MHQAVKIVARVRADAFAVKAHEERSRACSIKAPVVIENANLQRVMFLSRKNKTLNLNFLYAALDTNACAAFIKESRMNFANASQFHRKFGY
jgi:hypothetical protein